MKKKATAPALSLRAYAKHRGVSAMAVSKAVKSGRLAASVTRVDGQPKIRSAELADQEWDRSTDLTKAPTAVKMRAEERRGKIVPPRVPTDGDAGVYLGMSLPEAQSAVAVYKAQIAELDLLERRGELVDAKAMAAKIADVFTKVRTRVLAAPTRARQQLPHLTAADVGVLDSILREGLEELSLEVSAEADQDVEEREAARG